MPQNYDNTRFPNLFRIGAEAIRTTLLSSAVVGSAILGGNLMFDSNQNTAPSIHYDSGSYLTYQEARLTASGSRNLTAEIQISSDFSSGAVLQRTSVECGKIGKTATGSITLNDTTKQAATAGILVKHYVVISTGSVTQTMTGAGIVGSKISDNAYVSFIGQASGGLAYITGADCMFRVWTHEKYGK